MKHADTAIAGHRDCHPRFGDGIHRTRNQGHIYSNIARDPRCGIDLTGNDIRFPGQQQYIIESEP